MRWMIKIRTGNKEKADSWKLSVQFYVFSKSHKFMELVPNPLGILKKSKITQVQLCNEEDPSKGAFSLVWHHHNTGEDF